MGMSVDEAPPAAETSSAGGVSGETTAKEKLYSVSDVAKHDTDKDCWMIFGEDGEKKVGWQRGGGIERHN